MRHHVFYVLIFAVTLSCGDSDKIKKAAPGQMLVVVDGVEYSSTSIMALVRGASPNANPRASIEAKFDVSATQKFSVVLSASTQEVLSPIGPGEFVVEGIDIPNNFGIVYYSPDQQVAGSYVSFYVGEPVVGKITFTEVDTVNKLISGTFESKTAKENAGDIVTLKQGSFTSIPYTE
jgi:hypothetical protein